MHKKLLSIILVVFGILAIFILYFGVHKNINPIIKKEIKINGFYLPKAVEIKKFSLIDNHGKLFNNNNLKNHWSFLFFGFTNCGFVCPTTLTELNKLYNSLKKQLPQNLIPQIVFISVDPERDTVKRLNSYVTAFNKQFIGLRGDELKIEQLENEMHIVAIKNQAEGSKKNNYTIDHTAEILVINPKGQLQAYLSYPHKAEQMAKDYQLIIK